MNDTEVQCRLVTLKEFENNLNDRLDKLAKFVDVIGWSWDEIPEFKDSLMKCPVRNEHEIYPSKFDVHFDLCKLKLQGYYDKSLKLYPELGCHESFNHILHFDEQMQMEVIKRSHVESNFTLNIKSDFRGISQSIQQYVCEFTPDERRVLYDYAVSNTKKPNKEGACSALIEPDKFIKTNNEESKSELELLQEQRDAKRRRIAYRGKRVHTDRKSYVEVLREVIDEQINSLTTNPEHHKNINENIKSTDVKLVNNNRVYYKFEGSRFFSGNPYTRWMNIENEESDFLNKHSVQRERLPITSATTSTFHSNDNEDNHISSKIRKSRSRSVGKKTKYNVSKDKYNLERSRSKKRKKSSSPKEKHKKKSKSSKSHKKSHRSRSKSHKKYSKHYKSKSRSKKSKSRSRSRS